MLAGWQIEDAEQMLHKYAEGTGWDELATVLRRLVDWTNRNSDGWPYWVKPKRASEKLQEAISEQVRAVEKGFQLIDLDPTFEKRLLSPVKAFLTREGHDWREVLYPPSPPKLEEVWILRAPSGEMTARWTTDEGREFVSVPEGFVWVRFCECPT